MFNIMVWEHQRAMVERITISLDEELAERLNDRLEYGDSRSEWVREAIIQRLEREEADTGNQTAVVEAAD